MEIHENLSPDGKCCVRVSSRLLPNAKSDTSPLGLAYLFGGNIKVLKFSGLFISLLCEIPGISWKLMGIIRHN